MLKTQVPECSKREESFSSETISGLKLSNADLKIREILSRNILDIE